MGEVEMEAPEWWSEVVERGWSAALPVRTSVRLGGRLRATDEDFEVEELPAYAPSGGGVHAYLRVRRGDMTTRYLGGLILRAFGLDPGRERGALGYAGLKDRHAITTQWFSVNTELTKRAPEEAAATLEGEGVEVLELSRHTNKLKTGHLRGNRFRLRVRGIRERGPEEDLEAEVAAACLSLSSCGFPNWFGPQRFGSRVDNVEQGLAILRGERRARGRLKRLLVSSVQSAVFNAQLGARIEAGLVERVCLGDVLMRVETGGRFACEDAAVDQARLESGELSVTGILPGRAPMAESRGLAGALERRAMTSVGAVTALESADGAWGVADPLVDMSQVGRLAQGSRRAMMIRPEGLRYALEGAIREASDAAPLHAESCATFEFELPPGSYATSLMRELMGTLDFDVASPSTRGTEEK